MAETTKIQWAHHTFNPWRGCTKVSPGCQHCYAEELSHTNPRVLGEWGPQGKRVIGAEAYWRQPLKWDRAAAKAGERRRVFCLSLGDVFEDRPELVEPRVRLYHLISETGHLDWLLLTKRPENIRRFYGGEGVRRSWSESMPPNVWLGTSVEDQPRAAERIPRLMEVPAPLHFLSIEPLLGPINLSAVHWTAPRWPAWVIIGGESGRQARPCQLDWIRSLVLQCRHASVACFVKQLGARPEDDVSEYAGRPMLLPLDLIDVKGGNPQEWPEDLRIRELPIPREVAP